MTDMATRATSLLLASHPGPTLVVTAISAGLGLGLGYPPGRLALLALAVLLGQLSIGWSNDWLDAARDRAVSRADKPAARGDIPVAVVRASAFAALVLALAVTAILGPGALLAHLIAIAGGWAYNLGLKSTVWSFVPFAVSFGLLPAIATLGQETPAWPAPWVLAAGALLGVAAHITTPRRASVVCRTGWGRVAAASSRSTAWPSPPRWSRSVPAGRCARSCWSGSCSVSPRWSWASSCSCGAARPGC
jgi:hypothetical protein